MKRILLSIVSSACLVGSANAAQIYGVDENNRLIKFDSSAPGTTLSSLAITGLDNSLVALDFRPLNNKLYALGSDHIIYTVSLSTGLATAASGFLGLSGTQFAFDFNPTIDRLRIVSNTNENYVFNPNDGSLTVATPVFYGPGDPNAGSNPDVTAAAYTTSVFGAPGPSTQLYSIDTANDLLVKQANSAGTLTTVGALGFDLGSRTSFDIFNGEAFAFNGSTLYGVSLATGQLSLLGATDRALFGIAVAPVPEAESWALMILGLGAVGFALRRQRAAVRIAYA